MVPPALQGEDRKLAAKLYEVGWSSQEVADFFDVSRTAVYTALRKEEVPTRRSGPGTHTLDEAAFDDMGPEARYWVGFLMADGSVRYMTENSVSVQLKLKKADKGHLEKFRTFMGSTHPIHTGTSEMWGEEYEYAYYSFCSAKVGKILESCGIYPNKSEVEEAVRFEGDPHFWRGVVDGDGSVVVKKNPRITLYSSETLVRQFEEFVKTEVNGVRATPYEGPTTWVFTTYTGRALELGRVLYEDAPVALDRKRDCYEAMVRRLG